MRILILGTLLALFVGGCEKTIKDVRTTDAQPAPRLLALISARARARITPTPPPSPPFPIVV